MTGNKFNSFERYISSNQQSRWASPDEIQSASDYVRLSDKKYPVAGLPLISDGKKAWVDGSDRHSLIYGSTGSKKTRLFVMPTLCGMIKAEESFIVTDPKGELYKRTAGLAKANGYDIKVLNFRDIGTGEMWNPLIYPYRLYKQGDTDKASMLISDFVEVLAEKSEGGRGDPFWTYSAKSYAVAALLLLFEAAVSEDEVNLSSFASLCGPDDKNTRYLQQLETYMDKTSVCSINFNSVLNCADRTRRSIQVMLHSMISLFVSQKSLVAMLSDLTFDINDIGLKKTAFYIIVPDEKTTIHFLVTAFIKQAYEILVELAYRQKDGKLKVRTNFVLDEFCNIPKIPDMPNMISAARSRRIRYYLVVQSLHQLESRYGVDADTIKGNCLNVVFLTSKELALLNEISSLCGDVETPYGTLRPLISTSELQHLNKNTGEVLIIHDRCYPFITEMTDIDDYEDFAVTEVPAIEARKMPPVVMLTAKLILSRAGFFGYPFEEKDSKND